MDGRSKAIIEPNGIYLRNPPAKFRIVGQQRMKKKGITLIQDYDEAGSDILKCKRSGTVLPLVEEGGGILLLKTFKYQPSEEMRKQLLSYAEKLKKANNVLPHVIDLEQVQDGNQTILIMNEGKLKMEKTMNDYFIGDWDTQTLRF